MPHDVRKTPTAETDLQSIFRYVARENIPAAESLSRRIAYRLDQLSRNPLLGRARTEFGDFRSLLVTPYVIFYTLNNDGSILVVRILHQSRDLSAAMHEDDPDPSAQIP